MNKVMHKILVLTDHSTHSSSNSFYPLINALRSNPKVAFVDIATRNIEINRDFFQIPKPKLFVSRIESQIEFSNDERLWNQKLSEANFDEYTTVLLRIPRPVADSYLTQLETFFTGKLIINKPSGIIETGNKKYLLNFPQWTPPIELCQSINSILDFADQFPIVLKPLRDSGGKGIIKIASNIAEFEGEKYPAVQFLKKNEYEIKKNGYLAMKFLKNVSRGDKRIIVIGGKFIAASLRIPKKGSWLCNISQGGSAIKCDLTNREKEMIKDLDPFLQKEGILIYGLDTLEDDNGNRVLSEINTLSVGGFQQALDWYGKTIIENSVDKILKHGNFEVF